MLLLAFKLPKKVRKNSLFTLKSDISVKPLSLLPKDPFFLDHLPSRFYLIIYIKEYLKL